MRGEQLDLLTWREVKPMAMVIPFPVNREIMHIRETARVLGIKKGAAAERFWQTTCRRLYARLQVQGMNHDDIRSEINSFALAVQYEVRRQAPRHWESDNPKGAA